jgi:hypothetical protein
MDERLGLPSASSFYADALCPGRQNLIAALRLEQPEVDESSADPIAARGTKIHKAFETDMVFDLTPDELVAYQNGLKLKEQLLREWIQDFGITTYEEGPREARFWLHHPDNLSPLLSGQLDVHYLSRFSGHMLVIDYKTSTGRSAAPANRNWQGRIQALLGAKEYDGIKHVRFALIKPEAFGRQIDTVDFTAFTLDQIERSVYQVLWNSQQPDAPTIAGDHCRYCPAKAQCKAALTWAMQPIPYLEVVPQSNGSLTKKDVTEIVNRAPVEALREVFAKRSVLKYIMDAVAARLAALPEDEQYRLELKLNLGRSADYIRDTKAAYDALLAAGFSESDLFECLSFRKADLVRLYQRWRNCRDAEAEAWYESQMDEFIERVRGNPVLAEA